MAPPTEVLSTDSERIYSAWRALFAGDREYVDDLLRDRVKTLEKELAGVSPRDWPENAVRILWLEAHATEDADFAQSLLQMVQKVNSLPYQAMARDILERRERILKEMGQPPGWQVWFIDHKRGLIRLCVTLASLSLMMMLALWMVVPAEDPEAVALAATAAFEANATATQAAMLALTPSVTPSATPLNAQFTSGRLNGIDIVIVNCGFGRHLGVVRQGNPVPTLRPTESFSYFFIQFDARCIDDTDNVCSISDDLSMSLQLNNGSPVLDSNYRVDGEIEPDIISNRANSLAWIVFNVPENTAPQALVLENSRFGSIGTQTAAPVSIPLPPPCMSPDQ